MRGRAVLAFLCALGCSTGLGVGIGAGGGSSMFGMSMTGGGEGGGASDNPAPPAPPSTTRVLTRDGRVAWVQEGWDTNIAAALSAKLRALVGGGK
jgi:hypothetical protein